MLARDALTKVEAVRDSVGQIITDTLTNIGDLILVLTSQGNWAYEVIHPYT